MAKRTLPGTTVHIDSAPKAPTRVDGETANSSSASPPVMGVFEVAMVLSTLVDLLSASQSSVVLGSGSENPDPICEGLRRLLKNNTPIFVRRELIPGDPRTVEVFDVRDMIYGRAYVDAILNFRVDNSIPEAGMTCAETISKLGEWVPPSSVTGTFALEDDDGEDEDDDDD